VWDRHERLLLVERPTRVRRSTLLLRTTRSCGSLVL
jgi:hypothetical protein